jgi:hypothetical protein
MVSVLFRCDNGGLGKLAYVNKQGVQSWLRVVSDKKQSDSSTVQNLWVNVLLFFFYAGSWSLFLNILNN